MDSTQPKYAPGGSESSKKQAKRQGEASVDAPDTKKPKLDENSGKVKTHSVKKWVTKNVNNRILPLEQKRRSALRKKARLVVEVEQLRKQIKRKQKEMKKKDEEIQELDELRRFEYSHLEELLGFKVDKSEATKTVTRKMQSEAAEQKGAHGEVATTSVTTQADPPLDQDSPGAEDVCPLMTLFDVAQGQIFKDIYDYLPQRDQKALSETNKTLYEQYRKDWLGCEHTLIDAKLNNSADVQGFCDLMNDPALGRFHELELYLHCELGHEFAVDSCDYVLGLVCVFEPSFQGSYGDTLRKLGAAFPAVTYLTVRRMGTAPLAESGTDLSLSWDLWSLNVSNLPLSMFTSCSFSLHEFHYALDGVQCDAMYAIPSALFDACKDTLVDLNVIVSGNGGSFEVCRMDDVAKLTEVRELYLYDNATIGKLDMKRMPATLSFLVNGGRELFT